MSSPLEAWFTFMLIFLGFMAAGNMLIRMALWVEAYAWSHRGCPGLLRALGFRRY